MRRGPANGSSTSLRGRCGLSPTELRLQNMIGDDDMPTEMITGPTLDETMSTRKTLERAVELIDLERFETDRDSRSVPRVAISGSVSPATTRPLPARPTICRRSTPAASAHYR